MSKQAIFSCLFWLFLLLSCTDGKGVLPNLGLNATGPHNTLFVFCDESFFEGDLEKQLSDSSFLGKDFPGLYFSPEPYFGLRHYNLELFNRFQKSRALMKIEPSDSAYFQIKTDVFSEPQCLIEIAAPSKAEVKALIEANKKDIFDALTENEYRYFLGDSQKSDQAFPETDSTLNVRFNLAKGFELLENKKDFVRFQRKNVNQIKAQGANGSAKAYASIDFVELGIYKLDYQKDTLKLDEALELVDLYRAKFFRGKSDTDIPQIDRTVGRRLSRLQFEKSDDKYAHYLLNSYWSMSESVLAGPMMVKFIIDKEKKKLYIADAFMFAPFNPDHLGQNNYKKRNYLSELIGTFKTMQVK